ncbi:MAG: GDP-mannose 4,6-dehydratase [Chloroflexota bacterium]|nr:GDP-mannose 4,6-dehydratase [Chloroflexota bacterium]
MTRSLITGGAGFIGSHLADRLIELGHEVYIIDDLSTGSIQNVLHLKAHPKFHYELDTIMNEKLLAELVDTCDNVYHLAATVGVQLVVDSPVNTIENITKGTELVLKWASKKSKKVLITSTSEVYGKSITTPFTETDDLTLGPTSKGRWSYACSKMLDEFLALAYWRERKLPVVIVRLFNTVGPRQTGRYGMVIPRFVSQALAGEPLTVYEDGKMVRSFGYVGDVVGAIIDLMQHPNTAGEIYNIGNPSKITIEDLALLVIRLTESNSTLHYIPYRDAYMEGFEDIRSRVPNIKKINALTGYQPKVELDEIIRQVIAYTRDNPNSA